MVLCGDRGRADDRGCRGGDRGDIDHFGPIDQTFTAIDPELRTIAFGFSDLNPGFPNEPVTMTLSSGVGFTSPIHSVTVTLPGVLPPWPAPALLAPFDFTGTTLTVGGVYTAAVTVPSSPKLGVAYTDQDVYAGGRSISAVDDDAGYELRFIVEGVPAPGASAVAAMSLAGLARRRRR